MSGSGAGAGRWIGGPSPQDMVVAYATTLDARDWAGFETLLDETVEVDYRSLGTTYGRFPAAEWAARCRVLGAFDGTHHKVTNLVVALHGEDRATVSAYVDAGHFITAGGATLEAYVLGIYRHDFIRRRDGWRIAKCALTVTGYPGGRDRFDAAFAAARAAFTT